MIPGIVAGFPTGGTPTPTPTPTPSPTPPTYIGSHTASPVASEHTFVDVPLGPEYHGRFVYVLVSFHKSSGFSAERIAGCYIDTGTGQQSMPRQQDYISSTRDNASMHAIQLPLGETASIRVVATGTEHSFSIHVFTSNYCILNTRITRSTTPSATLRSRVGGVALAVAQRTNATDFTIDQMDTLFNEALNGTGRVVLGHADLNSDADFVTLSNVGSSTSMAAQSYAERPVDYVDTFMRSTTGNPQTFTVALGEDAPDRLIILSLSWKATKFDTTSITGVTYDVGSGPVAMTQAAYVPGDNTSGAELWYATIPAGGQAEIVVSAITDNITLSGHVIRKTGTNPVPTATVVVDSVQSPTDTIAVADNSFVAQAVTCFEDDATISNEELSMVSRYVHFDETGFAPEGGTGFHLTGEFASANAAQPVGFTSSRSARMVAAVWEPAPDPLPVLPYAEDVRYWFTADRDVYSDAAGTTPCGDGDPVYLWGNQGTNQDAQQSVEANRPTFRTNGQGGKPYIEAVRSVGQFFEDLQDFDWESGITDFSGWTMMAGVIEVDTEGLRTPIFGYDSASYAKADLYFQGDQGDALRVYKGPFRFGNFAAGSAHCFVFGLQTVASLTRAQDDQPFGTVNNSDNAASTTVAATQFLRKSGAGFLFNGKVYELIVWNRPVGSSEQSQLEIVQSYFIDKYQLGV